MFVEFMKHVESQIKSWVSHLKHLNITKLSWENQTHLQETKENLSKSTIDIRDRYLHSDFLYFKKQ